MNQRADAAADKNPTLRRLRIFFALMRKGRATAPELARLVGSNPRQVREDLKLLAALAPIQAEGERERRAWSVDPGLPMRCLGIFDRISLQLGRELGRFLQGTALCEGPEDFAPLDKLPPRYAANVDRKLRLRSEPARSYADCAGALDLVLDALLRERRLDFDYQSTRGPRRFEQMKPLSLVVYRRALYLLCRGDGRPDVLRLPVERISQVEVGEPFDYPADWDPDAVLSPYFGIVADRPPERVVLRFAARVVPYVRARTWHSSQRLESLPDGGVELRMKVGGSELVRWCLEWGENCTVQEPAWLREAVIGELRGALAKYGLEAGPSPETRPECPSEGAARDD